MPPGQRLKCFTDPAPIRPGSGAIWVPHLAPPWSRIWRHSGFRPGTTLAPDLAPACYQTRGHFGSGYVATFCSKSGTNPAPNLAPVWPQNLCHFGAKSGAILVPVLAPFWRRNLGPFWDQIRCHFGPRSDPGLVPGFAHFVSGFGHISCPGFLVLYVRVSWSFVVQGLEHLRPNTQCCVSATCVVFRAKLRRPNHPPGGRFVANHRYKAVRAEPSHRQCASPASRDLSSRSWGAGVPEIRNEWDQNPGTGVGGFPDKTAPETGGTIAPIPEKGGAGFPDKAAPGLGVIDWSF